MGATGGELHIGQGFLDGGLLLGGFRGERIGDVLRDGDPRVRGNAPGDGWLDLGGVDFHDIVEMGVGIRGEGKPAGGGLVEIIVIHVGTALEIGDSLGIGIDVSAARAAFDGHVADGHALLHGHALEDIARVLVGVADPAVRAEKADDVEDDVLRVNTRAEVAIDLDAADFQLPERDGLGGENVAHLAGADAERDRSEGTVGRRVGVPAGDGRSGLGNALLGADDVDDALFTGGQVEISDAEVITVFPDSIDHLRGQRIGGLVLVNRRHDVVDRRERALGEFHLQPQVAEHAERLRGRDLMDEVGADEELRAPVGQRAHAV